MKLLPKYTTKFQSQVYRPIRPNSTSTGVKTGSADEGVVIMSFRLQSILNFNFYDIPVITLSVLHPDHDYMQ